MNFDVTCLCHRKDRPNATITGSITLAEQAMEAWGLSFDSDHDKQQFEDAFSIAVLDLVTALARTHAVAGSEPLMAVVDALKVSYSMVADPDAMAELNRAWDEVEDAAGRTVEEAEMTAALKALIGTADVRKEQAASGLTLIQDN